MKKFLLAAAALTFAVTASIAGPVEDREAMMKGFGGALGQLGPIAKGEKPYDAAVVNAAIEQLSANAMKFDVAAMFPAGSGEGTEALPAIWENMADFEAKVAKFKADVAGVAANPPADQAAVGAALGVIGGNCGACHQTYRAKKS
ncbi:cytochrome c [Aquibium sp. ELW1220]|jgi:cytochrome c556|uniref:c-type cytochrome n=1 Tax=Aquibium sp. ELW1220 TaxID=2976766 RepID=UPI0025B17FED|nr:cytochrome c [Aquibium sp. ELW1220]MDN2583600.1 cytochrome c [Aquibium sp. ELW1220]